MKNVKDLLIVDNFCTKLWKTLINSQYLIVENYHVLDIYKWDILKTYKTRELVYKYVLVLCVFANISHIDTLRFLIISK